jgi:phosphatidylinositol glycan class B
MSPLQPFTRKVMLFSLILHLCCAWFSGGFYQYDEHFQILEFMNAVLGKTPFHDLPWEYHFQMRSWVQPFFYLGIQKLDSFFGMNSPLLQAFTFRLVTAFIGWVALFMLASRAVISSRKSSGKRLRFFCSRPCGACLISMPGLLARTWAAHSFGFHFAF